MTPRHLLLAAGVCVAGWLALFGDKTPDDGIAAQVTRAAASVKATAGKDAAPTVVAANAGSHAAAGKDERDVTILALRTRAELIGEAKAVKPEDALFGSQNWTPPPPPLPPPPPPPLPTAPPLPFTYIGKKTEDAHWEVYLARGEQTYIVRETNVVAGVYRIEAIKPPTMTLMYLPLNQTQTLNIGGAD